MKINEIIPALERANKYLRHPDVVAIKFALSSTRCADTLDQIIKNIVETENYTDKTNGTTMRKSQENVKIAINNLLLVLLPDSTTLKDFDEIGTMLLYQIEGEWNRHERI